MTLRPSVSEHDHVAGNAEATLTLVEYGDFQCPHCAAADPIVRAVQRELGSQLRFVFRHFPLAEIHPAAEPAAEFAEAAATAGKFWDAHHAIFAWSRKNGPESLGMPAFLSMADALGLDRRFTSEVLEEHRFLERIRGDFQSGVRSGVNGTPTFFVNGRRFDGARSVEALSTALTSSAT